MDPLPDSLTFEAFLTAAGAGVAAAIITSLVTLIQRAMPDVFNRVTGAALAFMLSAILYVLTGIAVGVDSLNDGLIVFVAWLTCSTAAVGVHQVVARQAITTHSTPPPEG